MSGTLRELAAAGTWLQKQLKNYKHVVCIAGNHDFGLEAFMKEGQEDILRRDFFGDVIYLRDNAVALGNRKFYGSPWQPWFYNWAFNVQRGQAIKKYWDDIPQCDVLVTHGPPKGILDWVGKDRVGCEELAIAVPRVNPKVHIFGHIHGAYGRQDIGPTQYYNASVVSEAYKLANQPWVIEI